MSEITIYLNSNETIKEQLKKYKLDNNITITNTHSSFLSPTRLKNKIGINKLYIILRLMNIKKIKFIL